MSLSYWRCAFEGDCGTSFIPLVPSLWSKTFCHMPVREVWSLKRSRGVRWISPELEPPNPWVKNCCSSLYVDMGDCYSNLNLTSTKSTRRQGLRALCICSPLLCWFVLFLTLSMSFSDTISRMFFLYMRACSLYPPLSGNSPTLSHLFNSCCFSPFPGAQVTFLHFTFVIFFFF